MDDSKTGKRIDLETAEPERLPPAEDAEETPAAGEAGEGEAGAEGAQEEPVDPAEEIARLQELCEQERDSHLRAVAELQNFKRRSARELAERLQFANQQLIAQLLPVVDDLERVLACDSDSTCVEDIIGGVRLVIEQLHRVLQSFGVERIEPDQERFDPSLHEAVALVETPDVAEGTILQVDAPGYRLHDRVLRPARVVVAKETAEQF